MDATAPKPAIIGHVREFAVLVERNELPISHPNAAFGVFEHGQNISTIDLLFDRTGHSIFIDLPEALIEGADPCPARAIGHEALHIGNLPAVRFQRYRTHLSIRYPKDASSVASDQDISPSIGGQGIDGMPGQSVVGAKARKSPRFESHQSAAAGADPEVLLAIFKNEANAVEGQAIGRRPMAHLAAWGKAINAAVESGDPDVAVAVFKEIPGSS